MAIEPAFDDVEAAVDPIELVDVLAVALVELGAEVRAVIVLDLIPDLGGALQEHSPDDREYRRQHAPDGA